MNKYEYSTRVVAFIDVLGFKNMVQDTSKKDILDCLISYFEDSKKSNYEGVFNQVYIDREFTFFSDSIVLSYNLDYQKIYYILIDIIHIQLDKKIYLII